MWTSSKEELGNSFAYVLNLRAVKLGHVLEVLKEKATVIITNSSDLIPALVSKEAELLLPAFNFCCLLREHEVKGGLLVVYELRLKTDLLDVILETAPLSRVLKLEEPLFLILKGSVCTDE